MNKPHHFFAFLLVLGLFVFGFSLLAPAEKVHLGPFEIGYYRPSDLLGPLWRAEAAPADVLDSASMEFWTDPEDSLSWSADEEVEEPVQKVRLDTLIQLNDPFLFASYFDALSELKRGGRPRVRIIHYGDSQLEGDRITSQLRNDLQTRYGGTGFGWVALHPLVAPAPWDFQQVQGFERKTAFGRRDTSIADMKYGLLASFTALEPHEAGGYRGSVTFVERKWGYSRARNFSQLRAHFEGEDSVQFSLFAADTLAAEVSFAPGERVGTLPFPKGVDTFRMEVRSNGPVRVYGLSFESPTGVQVDNVAMRGASGMVFRKLDEGQFQTSLKREDYELIILQYGGNAVPYLRDEAHAKSFARSAARQIDHIKKLYPEAAILYIGPSDMARKNGLKMETSPLIATLKSALRKEVLSRGAAYWDLYDVMGGKGSMVRWVEQEPAFAVSDYVHFTPYGSKWVGNKLAAALEELGVRYQEARREQARRDSVERVGASQAQGTGVKVDSSEE